MFDLYFFSNELLLLFFLLMLCIFVAQAILFGLIVANLNRKRIRRLISEVLMLSYCGAIALLPITVLINRTYGIVDISSITIAMYVIGVVAIIYFLLMAIIDSRIYILAPLCIAATLPYMEILPYKSYEILVAVVGVTLFLRARSLIDREHYRQKYELSSFSVKEGLDTLPTGVMFSGTNGYIYLINTKMQSLIQKFFTSEQKDSLDFWNDLQTGNIIDGECQALEKDILVNFGLEVWRFSRQEFFVDNTSYYEITAINVTEIVGTLQELEDERAKLLQQSDEVRKLSDKMETLRREQEYSRIRSQIHDVLSQRLTALQRLSRDENFNDYSVLYSLTQDVITQIKAKRGGDAKELFGEIYFYFRKIGLSIEMLDPLPKNEQVAFLFLAVLREACTNAVKHAGATKIYAKIDTTDTGYRIEITNNGMRPKKGLIEGGGLSGIRNRVENAGGTLKVEVIPEFSLIITIDRKETI